MNVAPTELLPALHALLETESVTLAARRMGVGQPAMSRTLERLRATTGDALLVRAGRGLVRTRRGDELLPEVRALVAAAERVLLPSRTFESGTAVGVVTLALGDDLQAMLAAPLLARLRSEAPGLDVRVRPLGVESVSEALRGIVDVVVLPDVRGQYTLPDVSELVLARQYTRRFVTVTRRKERLTVAAFAEREHLLVSPRGEEGG